MTQVERIRPYFLLTLIVGTFALTYLVFAPFVKPLVLAAVFAVVLGGLYEKILRMMRGWPSVAAFLTLLISVVLILLPLSLVGVLVGNEAGTLYGSLQSSGGAHTVITQVLERFNQSFGSMIPGVSEFTANAPAHITEYTQATLQWIAANAAGIFSGASEFLLACIIFFIALYYFLRDGKRVRQILIELSPLNDSEDRGVFNRLELAINSVIKGNLTLALLQGVLSTIGLAFFGVPSAVLWGTVASLAALIPGIGTGLVILPAAAYLFLSGATAQGLGLLAWGAIGVGLIDNFLGPKLVGKAMNVHPLLVLLSVLGGLAYFGPAGIFLGPLCVSLLFALLSIYTDISRPA